MKFGTVPRWLAWYGRVFRWFTLWLTVSFVLWMLLFLVGLALPIIAVMPIGLPVTYVLARVWWR